MKSFGSRYDNKIIIPSIIIVTFLLSVFISYTQPFRTLELKLTDQLFEWRGPLDVSESPIVLVAISDQADSEIPQKFPWPTDVYARLIRNLNKAGAKTIGIDVIFRQPDTYDLSNDTTFSEAISKYGNVVLVGNLLHQKSTILPSGNLKKVENNSQATQISKNFPLPLLQRGNPNPVGMADLVTDSDGFIRKYRLRQRFLDKTYYSFGLEVLKDYKNIDSSQIQAHPEYLELGEYQIPKINRNSMIINYYGGPKTFPLYSFDQVIDDSTYMTVMEEPDFQVNAFDDPDYGLLHTDVFKNKIVLVGSTMLTLHDLHPTPFANSFYESGNVKMPGFEIHAHALQTILDENYYNNLAGSTIVGIILLISIITVLSAAYTGAIWGLILMVAQIIGYIALVGYAFMHMNLIIEITGVLLASIIGYISTQSFNYLAELREKGRIRNMFASYVSPELVDELIESGHDPQLGGDEVYITAFFSDIESFSTFSEKLDAKQLVELINDYLTEMTTIITDRSGTLDKYIGDAIVAFFGAPIVVENHAYEACVASQLMQYKQAELRRKWEKDDNDWPEIVYNMKTRIGINTGSMVTGNMGSIHRFNYTMMGDNVNLAARCESGAKSYGVYTMVTQQTKKEAEEAGDRCVFRYLDKIVVKGRSEPVEMYEIVGLRNRMNPKDLECISIYEEAQQYYLNKDFKKAETLFRQSEELEPRNRLSNSDTNHNPSKVFIERCQNLHQDPPDAKWNGVYIMENK